MLADRTSAATGATPQNRDAAHASARGPRKGLLRRMIPRGMTNWYFRFLAWFSGRSFALCEKLGFYIIHRAFYGPIPDTRELSEELWQKHSQLVGIDMRPQAQLELIRELSERYGAEYAALPRAETSDPTQYYYINGLFGPADAELAYGLVRRQNPKRLIEVGSGNSTRLMAQAVRKNEAESGRKTRYTVIDPYPGPAVASGIPGVSELIKRPVQKIPLEVFTELSDGDILFIDSSHVMKVGSDVQYQFLEILPRLQAGVYVHFHDIFLPAEYNRAWIMKYRRFWNEQYILQTFLTYNDHFEVLWGSNYMKLYHDAALRKGFPSVSAREQPGSFWIRKTK